MADTQNLPPAKFEKGGEEVYNILMEPIEPDLLTQNIPTLEEKYKNETSEQRKARYKQYEQAYAEYDKVFAEWQRNVKEATAAKKREALATAEAKSRKEEEQALVSIESKMNSAS